MANVNATSRQNQSNIDETQRDVVRRVHLKPDPELNAARIAQARENIRKGLIKQRKNLI